MTAIGFVTRTDNGGYRGELKTLSIRAHIDIVPNSGKSTEAQPDFRIIAHGAEIGAGWIRRMDQLASGPCSMAPADAAYPGLVTRKCRKPVQFRLLQHKMPGGIPDSSVAEIVRWAVFDRDPRSAFAKDPHPSLPPWTWPGSCRAIFLLGG
ncbi:MULTISPECIES: DUF736 domain-containing protein [Bradyrhizobium]|jgi:uncharacterized protein DUF736|uniref:DUF736 domain-containing protein n=1 Tax=Bradyrhizobium TaxID=374 RepID=UPI00054DE903|nr:MULTISPECIES: DUF736 family protein [Bradyrhizobium]MCS3447239.1 hypothetical protein [Bradyrhizobium elkanii]MCS3561624.1 hypothetical protein [Bradyrhizobium elkanii]MCW2148535.1 hypothetical protein [Bradyrhizobium elkanii]MCW2352378.1 hypothetical protein [Bradyrhizobium elkanii]MCW2372263.1 hypothetical protein [Bradyrhizobium elkanii]